MSHGYGEARPIGRMVPAQAHQERLPDASCARCACRLSRYRDAWEHHCCTCRDTLIKEGALKVPVFEADQSGAHAAQAHALALDSLLCKTCSRPLVKGGRAPISGLCRTCLDKKRAAEKPVSRCGGCGITVNRKTAYQARKQRRAPRCRDCYQAEQQAAA